MNKQIILDPFSNVVATGVAVGDMNKFLGTVVEKITLDLGGTTFTPSHITSIQLKLNGKVVWESSGARLVASNTYLGGATDNTKLKIDFMDRKAVTVNARQVGSIDLSAGSGVTSARLEVSISGATAPTLGGFVDVSPPTADPAEAGIRPLIARRHAATVVVGAAGTFALPIPHLDPAGGGSNYRRIYIYSANMTGLKTQREGVTEHELTKAQNEAAQKDNGRVPQTNLFVFDPCQDGQLTGRTWDTRPVSGVRSAQLYATFSAGETITIETDELLPIAAY
ncbi:MAG TPA: major capsid protein P2 [Ottowia sp.]|nr:major capsid protein P2 [Ottowia sp.]HNI84333.1 major capsid protein P2 [Ottowia sp.]HNJ45873.1 major capsid protein P2 [Ottowia sp.]HNK52876.1 major capsid protein P2 [Ottowia sp.]HNL40987.1 major capsid protein P2 [Ottowia sp.]